MSNNLISKYEIGIGSIISHIKKDLHNADDDNNGKLSFNIANWGVKDFINERNYWIKGTNLTHGNEPGWFYFKVFFNFKTAYGLFGGVFRDDTDIIRPVNSAIQYLMSLDKHNLTSHLYKSLKLKHRINALSKFSSMLFDTTVKTPWMIKGISNLNQVMNIYTNDFSNEKSFDILFNTETTDFRLGTLIDLYKYACYDDINCKEILPENLRKFDMTIVFFHIPLKYIHTGVSMLKYDKTAETFGLIDNAAQTVTKMFGNNKYVNKGVNVVQGIADVAKVYTSNSILFNYKSLNGLNQDDFSHRMSFRMYTFHDCEINTESFGKYVDGVDIKNETPFQFGNTALKINYSRVYYHNMNEWNDFMFGSDGFYYNRYSPFTSVTAFKTDSEYDKKEKSALESLAQGDIGGAVNSFINKNKNKNNASNNTSLNQQSFDIPILIKSESGDKWNERMKSLGDTRKAGRYSNPLSETQWKPLLDYSEIAIHESLRSFDMNDLVIPNSNFLNYDPSTGNIYDNYTSVEKDNSIFGAITGVIDKITGKTKKGEYFTDKMEQMVNGKSQGNLFGDICKNISSSNDYYNKKWYNLLHSQNIKNSNQPHYREAIK